jgi:hypothetical protein
MLVLHLSCITNFIFFKTQIYFILLMQINNLKTNNNYQNNDNKGTRSGQLFSLKPYPVLFEFLYITILESVLIHIIFSQIK